MGQEKLKEENRMESAGKFKRRNRRWKKGHKSKEMHKTLRGKNTSEKSKL